MKTKSKAVKTSTLALESLKVTLQPSILTEQIEINSALSPAINPIFQGHYFNLDNNLNGIKGLIIQILVENNCIFDLKNANDDTFRDYIINHSLYTFEIVQKIKELFSQDSTRYPQNSIEMNLSVHMLKEQSIGKIQLAGFEDVSRTSPRPRCKWFLSMAYFNNLKKLGLFTSIKL